MSTTFAVQTKTDLVNIARRSSIMWWTNPLGEYLPDNTPVIPIDNTAQGIHTIGDIKKEVDK